MDFLETPVDTTKPITKPKERKNMKITETVKQNYTTGRLIAKNVAEFVDAACLSTVSGFAIYQAHFNHQLKQLWADALLFAGLVIALQAFVLLVRSFNKIPAQHVIVKEN